MKKNYFFSALATLFLLLSACQKEEMEFDLITSSAQLTTQQQLDLLSPPLVLFQYSLLNLDTRQETGWIIDRHGNIKAYQTTWPLDRELEAKNERLQKTDLINLYALATETLGSVEIEELLQRIHQGYGLSKKFLTSTEIDQDNRQVLGFYAFSPTDMCTVGSSHHDSASGTYLKQIVHLSGYLNRYETSIYATDLHRWLIQTKDSL